jgi:uncharacterized protein YwgA
MKRLQRNAIVLSVIEKLFERGSWCGETHIQKSTYFLQELLNVPLDFEFILYKHGPFSFDLSDELLAMRADEIIQLQSRSPYGASIVPAGRSKLLKAIYPNTLRKYRKRVEFIANELGGKGASALERVATALYVSLKAQAEESINIGDKAAYLHKLKPHISLEEAGLALEDWSNISDRARDLVEAP